MHTATPEPVLIFPPCNRYSINPSLLLSFFIIKLVLLQLLNYHCKKSILQPRPHHLQNMAIDIGICFLRRDKQRNHSGPQPFPE